tara:strand:- start:860 stop:1156 length:297 start_codon:yes stop_codon:yes gene_type:complete
MEENKLNSKDLNLREAARALKIPPSKKAILQMPYHILIKHNALIFHKGSSLSSAQRKMVQDRVTYCVSKGLVKIEDVAREVNLLSAAIRSELNKREDK